MSIKNNNFLQNKKEALHTRSVRMGSYSTFMTVIVLGILIAVNVLASSLPKNLTQFDISAHRLYSVTSNTKVVVNNLKKDVTVYWISQSGKEDDTVGRLLNVYDAMSDHVTVEKKNPDVYPTFASQYTEGTVNNNSLVVVCGDRYRYIDYNDIYDADTSSYYSTGSVSYSFDGEGEITSAINYVVSEDLPQIYMTSGHGEADLTTSFTDALTRANMETQSFSLLKVDEVPEEADMVLVNSPSSDFSEEEVEMLKSYVSGGGKLLVLSGPQNGEDLTNLKSFLTGYGVSVVKGIVMEEDRDHYGFNYPYILIPDIQTSDITTSLTDEGSLVLMPLASGLTVDNTATDATVTSLLNTSENAFSKVDGYDMSSAEKEDDDIEGCFALAVSIQESGSEGQAVWIASDSMLDDQMVSYSSGANTDFIMNSISWMTGDDSGIAIASKSMDYTYLTISESQASIIRICMIGIIPLLYLLYGLDEVIVRRKKK